MADIKARVQEAQIKFREPYRKMMRAVDNGNRDKWISAITCFYRVAENRDLDENLVNRSDELTDEELKDFCKELCTEAINRDFVSWVSTNSEGNVGREVYKALM